MIDDVDAVGDSHEVFYPRGELNPTTLWNGREVTTLAPKPTTITLFQFIAQDKPFPHAVEQLVLDDEAPSEFTFAPCAFLSEQLTFDYSIQPAQVDLSGFFHRVWHGVKKGARKVAETAKKALEKVAHGTKKAAHNVEKYVRDHKKEILIVTAIATAAVGAYFVSGACLAGAAGTAAAAAGAAAASSPSSPRKKEDEPSGPVTAASPPSTPPPLPDWVENLLKSAAPTLSLTAATDAELENAKKEIHNALEGVNQFKILTEADLAPLRKEDHTFDPRATAIEIITNTILNDVQRREFSKTSSAEQNWRNFIQTGHQRIDEAFITASFYRAALKAATPPTPPQPPAFSFLDKIKLGLEIIGRGMMEPELLDTNTRLDVFLKDRNITVPIENSNQTVSEFINKIKQGLETIGRSSIDSDLLDPNSPWDIHLQNLTENRKQSEFGNSIKRGIENIGKGSFDTEHPNSPGDLFLRNLIENGTQANSSILKNFAQYFSWEKVFPPTPDLPYPDILTGIQKDCISKYFKIDGIIRDGMRLTWINGMSNTVLEDSAKSAKHIQNSCPENLCIHGIYNHSNLALDLFEVFILNYNGYSPINQDLLIQDWTQFHEENKDRPNAKILHHCHSQGAPHTKNALMRLPEEIRKRVIVIAIAPATVVPRRLCYDSFNYASKKDLVPLGELLALYWRACSASDETEREELLINIEEIQKELIWLEPHEGAKGCDHEFLSPTFLPKIKEHIEDYYRRQGEYK